MKQIVVEDDTNGIYRAVLSSSLPAPLVTTQQPLPTLTW